MASCMLLVVDESSMTMLESDSRYLPVLSDHSSEASPPQNGSRDLSEKRLTGDTAAKPQQRVADGVIYPTKSTSDPKSRNETVGRHTRCTAARTLCLESIDAEVDNSVTELAHSQDMEVCGLSEQKATQQMCDRLTDIERKSTERTCYNNSDVASAELYVAGKYGDAEEYGNGGELTRQSFDISSDMNSFTVDKQLDAAREIAAVRIQSLWRGYHARQIQSDVIRVRHEIRLRRMQQHVHDLRQQLYQYAY